MNNEKPQILIINGSPRKQKNCYNIAKEISKVLDNNNISNKIFNLYEMNINYCTACGFCEKKGYCKFEDDMTPMYDMFDSADGNVIISPIHFNSISAKLKTLVDRTQAIYASKYILKKSCIDRDKKRVGMYISVAGSKSYPNQFEGGDMIMDLFFKSINTNLKYNVRLNNTDDISVLEQSNFQVNLNENLNQYIKEVNEI